jgi:hypothetical protein
VKDNLGKILKVVAIVFMGLTAAMNILGGIGTVCAAFLTKQYPPMWALLDYQWLYQIIMIVTIALGLAGVWATIKLTKGGETVYRNAVILLGAGTAVGAVQVIASLALRGKAVPANMKLYINALTLILFLLFRLPGIRERVSFTKGDDQKAQSIASGLTAILTGALVLSTAIWVGGSHVHEGFNWVMVLREPLLGGGAALLGIGLFSCLRLVFRMHNQELNLRNRDRLHQSG